MKINIHMSLDEWEIQKKKLFSEGTDNGHQTALRFLKHVLDCPTDKYEFGTKFPEDLKNTIYSYVEMARGRIPKLLK